MAEPGLLGEAADLVPDAVLLVRLDGQVIDHNQAAARFVPAMRPGASLFDMVTDPPVTVREALRRWAATGSPVVGALTFNRPGGPVRCRCRAARARWVSPTGGPGAAEEGGRAGGEGPGAAGASPGAVVHLHVSVRGAADVSAVLTDRFAVLNREVAYRQRAATERERLLVAEQQMRDRVERLYGLSTALAASTTLVEVTESVRQEAAASLGGFTAVLGLFPDQVLPSFAVSRAWAEAWTDLDRDGGGLLATAARSGAPVLITSPERPLAAYSHLAASREHAAYCVPLGLRDERLGVLAVALGGAHDESLLERQHGLSVAAQVAQAVARARLFEHEHRLAERLQRNLLPVLPDVPHLVAAARYLPASESVRVGGDWYDLFEVGRGLAGVAIGDVAGHSLSEATMMAQLHNALRAFAMEHREPGEVLARLNQFTHAFLPTTMATACYLTLDTEQGRLSLASAGHLPPLLIAADGRPRLLWGSTGPPLGAAPGACYPSVPERMAAGDTLLLYTDGLIEQRRESLDTGLDRLLARAREAAGMEPRTLCGFMTAHGAGPQPRDDRALLAVRLTAGRRDQPRPGA